MSAAPKQQASAEPVTIARLAREALGRLDGDAKRATDFVVDRLSANAVLLREVVRAAVGDAVTMRVGEALRKQRSAIVSATTGDRGAVVALSTGWTAALLDMPLAGGKRLREATREEVVAQAHRYDAQAKDMGHKARWLTLVAQAVPSDKVVGDVMDDARAAELFAEARHG